MSLIDFKEIPKANSNEGQQDTFELFAREFLCALGFRIQIDPDRGQDGGRDLIVIEKRTGILNNSDIRWLVSCKHKAHSASSVLNSDEEDVSDRIRSHRCHGFIGFYSTIISSPLNKKLEKLREDFEIQIFDHEKIERVLINNEIMKSLIKRFFPKSFNNINLKVPSNLLSQYMPLKCDVCGKDLLHADLLDDYSGVVVFVEDTDYREQNNLKNKYVDIYFACKGSCDETLEDYHFSKGHSNGWNDISDLIIPYKFLQFYMAILNRIRAGEDIYTDATYEKLKHFLIAISQIVMKNQSEHDLQRIRMLQSIPEGL